MAYSKMSVTIPEEIFNEVKEMATKREIKISRLVTEALAEKLKKVKEESFVSQVNAIFEDPEATKEQRKMAEDITNSMDIKELPW